MKNNGFVNFIKTIIYIYMSSIKHLAITVVTILRRHVFETSVESDSIEFCFCPHLCSRSISRSVMFPPYIP